MPVTLQNPWRGRGFAVDTPWPRSDASGVARLIAQCPAHAPTPLLDLPALARLAKVAQVHLKDERARMGLGSFKALGAAHAIAREAETAVQGDNWAQALAGRCYVTASAGNHGLSVAAGARAFGARAVIYLAETVPEAFVARLKAKGAEVVREGATYEAAMKAAEAAAKVQGWTLLSDSSWRGYTALPLLVMEGYLQLIAEAAAQIANPPTHIIIQAGVGGLAAAVAAHARRLWADKPQIIVVEPMAAPALMDSILAGQLSEAKGPVSSMGRLDCKTPSMIALHGLSRDADLFVTITEEEAARGVALLAAQGLVTTPSGGAGMAALLNGLELGAKARVLAFLTE
ncbi:MAG: pyridoxal-phosphate dependent enzyme [Pararhodobacter sp.]|nr:pyridoxal-phosphate dependent enzyme [Pararhodobacter sp.]